MKRVPHFYSRLDTSALSLRSAIAAVTNNVPVADYMACGKPLLQSLPQGINVAVFCFPVMQMATCMMLSTLLCVR